jgi:long-chain fatty acid transport protein
MGRSDVTEREVIMNGKKILVLLVTATAAFSVFALGNGLNLNGLGSRAVSMGGAFVGLADDWSAVYWNPAGAASFDRPVLGFSLADLIPSSTYVFDSGMPDGPPSFLAESLKSHYLCGMGAYYKPVSRGVVVGFGVATPSGLGANWDGNDFVSLGGAAYEWTSRIGVFSLSPLVAVQVRDWLSLGATIHINYGSFRAAMPAGSMSVPGDPPLEVDLGQYEESMTGWGFGATLGILVRPADRLGLGLTVRTASTMKFKGSARISNFPFLELPGESTLRRDVTWPLWIGTGISWRPVDKLTLTADLQWTQWSKIEALETRYEDPTWVPLMEETGNDVRTMSWMDKAQIRLGAEYRPSQAWALRAGYTSDPSPAPDATMNVLLPSTDFHVLAVGVGRRVGDLDLAFGLEYLSGKDRTVAPSLDNMPGIYTMSIIVPSLSIGYRF